MRSVDRFTNCIEVNELIQMLAKLPKETLCSAITRVGAENERFGEDVNVRNSAIGRVGRRQSLFVVDERLNSA